MCRLAVYIGPPLLMSDLIIRPQHSIIHQSHNAREMLTSGPVNGDGFGIGWYTTDTIAPGLPSNVPAMNDDRSTVNCSQHPPSASTSASGSNHLDAPSSSVSRKPSLFAMSCSCSCKCTSPIDYHPCVFTSVTPAWNNLNLRRVSDKISSPLFFAHVRAATPGLPTNESNCHPFQFGRLLWMHNGMVISFSKMKRQLLNSLDDRLFQAIQGTTDSEHCFMLFLQILFTLDKEHDKRNAESPATAQHNEVHNEGHDCHLHQHRQHHLTQEKKAYLTKGEAAQQQHQPTSTSTLKSPAPNLSPLRYPALLSDPTLFSSTPTSPFSPPTTMPSSCLSIPNDTSADTPASSTPPPSDCEGQAGARVHPSTPPPRVSMCTDCGRSKNAASENGSQEGSAEHNAAENRYYCPFLLKRAMEETIKQVNLWQREVVSATDTKKLGGSLLNFSFTDGRSVVATCYTNGEADGAGTASLYYASGSHIRPGNDGQKGDFQMQQQGRRQSCHVIASEPLTNDPRDWVRVPKNHLVLITPDRNLLLYNIPY